MYVFPCPLRMQPQAFVIAEIHKLLHTASKPSDEPTDLLLHQTTFECLVTRIYMTESRASINYSAAETGVAMRVSVRTVFCPGLETIAI